MKKTKVNSLNKKDSKDRNRFNWKIFVISLVIVYGVAFLGNLLTFENTNSEWYNSIKPSITPPDYVFPIVWNILFFLIALSFYLAWTSSKKQKIKNKILLIFGINLFLNIFWSFLFFGLKSPAFAFIELIFLEFSILAMILITRKINKLSSYLLIPYFVWVLFAGFLNYLIAFRNIY